MHSGFLDIARNTFKISKNDLFAIRESIRELLAGFQGSLHDINPRLSPFLMARSQEFYTFRGIKVNVAVTIIIIAAESTGHHIQSKSPHQIERTLWRLWSFRKRPVYQRLISQITNATAWETRLHNGLKSLSSSHDMNPRSQFGRIRYKYAGGPSSQEREAS